MKECRNCKELIPKHINDINHMCGEGLNFLLPERLANYLKNKINEYSGEKFVLPDNIGKFNRKI